MSTSAQPRTGRATASPALSRAQWTGLVLGGLMSLAAIPPLSPPEGEVGPPLAIVVLASATGVVGVVAAVLAWRTHAPVWRRVLAGALLVNAVSALPAFFVPEVPLLLVVLAAALVVLTLVVVALLFTGPRRA